MIEIKHKNFRKKFMFLDILFLNLFFDWYSYHYLLNTSTLLFMSARPIIILHFLLNMYCTTASRMYNFSKSYICYLITTLMLIFLMISSVPILSPIWSTWDDEKLENSSKTLISRCCSELSSLALRRRLSWPHVEAIFDKIRCELIFYQISKELQNDFLYVRSSWWCLVLLLFALLLLT